MFDLDEAVYKPFSSRMSSSILAHYRLGWTVVMCSPIVGLQVENSVLLKSYSVGGGVVLFVSVNDIRYYFETFI